MKHFILQSVFILVERKRQQIIIFKNLALNFIVAKDCNEAVLTRFWWLGCTF